MERKVVGAQFDKEWRSDEASGTKESTIEALADA